MVKKSQIFSDKFQRWKKIFFIFLTEKKIFYSLDCPGIFFLFATSKSNFRFEGRNIKESARKGNFYWNFETFFFIKTISSYFLRRVFGFYWSQSVETPSGRNFLFAAQMGFGILKVFKCFDCFWKRLLKKGFEKKPLEKNLKKNSKKNSKKKFFLLKFLQNKKKDWKISRA